MDWDASSGGLIFRVSIVVLKNFLCSSYLALSLCWEPSRNQFSSHLKFKETELPFRARFRFQLAEPQRHHICVTLDAFMKRKQRKEGRRKFPFSSFARFAFIGLHFRTAINYLYFQRNKVQNPCPDIQGDPWFDTNCSILFPICFLC